MVTRPFPAQGVVAETLNLQAVAGYATAARSTSSRTTRSASRPTRRGRSTRYSSDLAKGFDSPIFHVNADDLEAAIAAIRLAMAFRARFRHDVVVDLVGYRRFGHNEQDEPAYTQPLMVKAIEATCRCDSSTRSRSRARASCPGAGRGAAAQVEASLKEAHEQLKEELAAPREQSGAPERRHLGVPRTAVEEATLRELNEELLAVPEGFQVHPKLARQLERRRETLGEGADRLGPGRARLREPAARGHPVRLTGQDSERGTFSHRHLVLHDHESAATHVPIQHLSAAAASCEVYNSPLSEFAALGFEYGYSVAVPNGLVLWEAQFGDFVNGAQIIIDQFLVSGFAKWEQTSRLTLLCPTATRATDPSTRAPEWSASSSRRRATSGSRTARRPRSTSTSCACRRTARLRARSSSSRRRAFSG